MDDGHGVKVGSRMWYVTGFDGDGKPTRTACEFVRDETPRRWLVKADDMLWKIPKTGGACREATGPAGARRDFFLTEEGARNYLHECNPSLVKDAPPEAKADDNAPDVEDCAHGVHSWDGPAGRRECGECGTPKPPDCACDFRKGQHRFSCATQGRSLPATRTEGGQLRVDLPPHALDTMAQRLGASPAPSPLDVVRKLLDACGSGAPDHWTVAQNSGATLTIGHLRALATLEESVRADVWRQVETALGPEEPPATPALGGEWREGFADGWSKGRAVMRSRLDAVRRRK